MKFRNPQNGYVETISTAGLWCLLFGSVYFISKGVWTHAAMWFVLTVSSAGLAWIIYPFFARQAVATAYLRKGWTEEI